MKVAIVQEQIDARRGGAETSVLEMARQLAALGMEVTLVCAACEGATDAGVEIALCPVGAGSKVVHAIRFVAEADRYCHEHDFDIVHAVTPCFSCNVYQPRGGTYVETVERSIGLATGFWTRLLKRLGRRFNRRQRFLLLVERGMLNTKRPPYVAAVSEYVMRQVITAFPRYPKRRLRVVFNGVDLAAPHTGENERWRAETRRKLGIATDRPVLLFVAHNFKLKGLRELIGALARVELHECLAGRESPLLLIAGRDNPKPYERQARRAGIAAQVRFLDAVDDLRPFYAAADALVHPTWYDPCSRVVLEALGQGLPAVTTRLNGAAEIMRDGVHGAVVESPRNLAELARAIGRCLAEELRTACRAAAPALSGQLSMARHARELAELYKEIAGEQRKKT